MGLAQVSDEIADLNDLLWVKTNRRLVENDNGGISHKCLGDTNSLAVSLGKILDKSAAHIVDLRYLADLLKMLLAIKLAALDLVNEIQVFVNGHINVKGRLLGQKSDKSFSLVGIFEYVNATNTHLS